MKMTIGNGKWHERFMKTAESVAEWSKDRSTKVGCVIVDDNRIILATGYNGFPRGVDDEIEERHERPAKYSWTEHAERNAIYSAARNGTKLEDSTIYIPWLPCADCARGIIQSGIKNVVSKRLDKDDPLAKRWAESHDFSKKLMEEGRVRLYYLEDLLKTEND